MNILAQLGVILGVCLFGELITFLLPFSFPSSVASMLILFLLFCLKLIKPEQMHETTEFFQKNMALFFIPAGVNIIASTEVLKGNVLALVGVCVITTVVTFAVTAYAVTLTAKLLKSDKEAE